MAAEGRGCHQGAGPLGDSPEPFRRVPQAGSLLLSGRSNAIGRGPGPVHGTGNDHHADTSGDTAMPFSMPARATLAALLAAVALTAAAPAAHATQARTRPAAVQVEAFSGNADCGACEVGF